MTTPIVRVTLRTTAANDTPLVLETDCVPAHTRHAMLDMLRDALGPERQCPPTVEAALAALRATRPATLSTIPVSA